MCNTQGACVGCITAANCGTDTPCQTHTCSAAGVCGVTNATAGTVLPAQNQTAGDCKRVQCDGQGQSTTVNDDTDKPVDGNACTKDLCSAGIASNPPEDSGTTCNQSNGTRCNGSGSMPACVQCLQPSDCPGTDTECHHRTCSATGVCGISNDPDGKLVQTQTSRDCKKNICMGGAEVAANDDLDVPADGNGCTNDLCTGGVPSHTPLGINASCDESGGTRCNGAGACVLCTATSQCDPDSFCQTFTCSLTGQCVPSNTGNGTALPAAMQIASDCKKKVCNGAGGVVELADDADVIVDGNACTSDTCSNGAPQNTSLPAGTQCSQSNGSMCNGSATSPACVECVSNANCGTDTQCQVFTCSASGQCSSAPRNEGMTVSDAPGDCKKDVCTSGAITTVNDNNDVPADNNPCTDDTCSNGMPQNMNVSATVSCGPSLMCDGYGNCVGCITAANCPTGNACQVAVCKTGGICDFTNVAEFTAVTDTMAGDCHTNECDGNGGIRSVVNTNDKPSNNGNECMQGTCNGGAPAVIPQNSGFACTTGTGVKCDGAGACVECLGPSECPGDDDECSPRTCISGVCGTQITPVGTPVMVQISGDCKDSICDGFGGVTTTSNNSDPPAPTNDCMTPACSAGNVTLTPTAHGTTCTQNNGRTCDGSGTCRLTFNVVRIGDGVTPLASGTSAPVFIEERTLNGAAIGTVIGTPVPLPTALSGANLAYTNSGSGSSEGGLSLSGDGKYVTLVGYNTGTGTAPVSTTPGINRLVARVDAAGNFNTTTLLTAFIGDNVRGATTQDGSVFWVGGSSSGTSGGVWSVLLGSTGAGNQVVTTPNNASYPHIFDGQLYISASNGTFRSPMAVGSGLPTTGPIMPTTLPGLPIATASPNSYVFFDRDSSIAGVDTLYIADDGGASVRGIQKWTKGASGWMRSPTTLNVTPAVGFKGLAGVVTGSTITLIASTADSAVRLVVFVDDGVTAPVIIGAAPTNEIFRGVALAPHL
jgi:hypothetical protein